MQLRVVVNSVSHGVLPCTKSCLNRDYKYAALARGHHCFCGNNTGAPAVNAKLCTGAFLLICRVVAVRSFIVL